MCLGIVHGCFHAITTELVAGRDLVANKAYNMICYLALFRESILTTDLQSGDGCCVLMIYC